MAERMELVYLDEPSQDIIIDGDNIIIWESGMRLHMAFDPGELIEFLNKIIKENPEIEFTKLKDTT